MNLLFIQETNWFTRGPHQQHHLAERLALRGHRVRVIDYELDWRNNDARGFYSPRQVFNSAYKIDKDARIELIRPGMLRLPILNYLSLLQNHRKEIEYQINSYYPDAVIAFGILNAYLASILCQNYQIPFIYYWIDVLHRLIPFKLFQSVGRLFEQKTLKKSSVIVVINRRLKHYLTGFGAPQEKICVIPAGIDIYKYSRSTDGSNIRQRFDFSTDDIVLFFMGWLYKFSGLKEVALELVSSEHKRIKLLVVGDGESFEELRQIKEKYKLGNRLVLTGKRPYSEMPDFISASDICILPAYPWEKIMQDIVPIKIYEYMAMGKPVISTRLPGVVTEFGLDNGVIYVDEPQDVVNKALELYNSNLLTITGLRARKFVETQSWDAITSEFQKVIEQAIKENKDADWKIGHRIFKKL